MTCERGRTVFVDRVPELRGLAEALAAARGGQACLAVIEGVAGIGKTTLVEHFLAGLDDVRVLRASSDEFETHLPFAMADQVLRSGGGDSDALSERSHVAVGLHLLELLAGSDAEATCVFVDDAHFTDPESLRALLFAARRLTTSPVMLVLAVRGSADETLPEAWRKLATGPAGRTIGVQRLSAEHIAALGSALGTTMAPAAAHRLWEHTDGNPLYACAVLRELPADGLWQYEHRPLPVPRSYAQLIGRRMARCPPAVASLIEAAAVLGVRSPLHAVLELVDADCSLEIVDESVATGLVRIDERRAGAVLEFVHPLTRAAVYAAIPTARRSRLNRTAAEVVENPLARMRHRVEAATVVDASLVSELEQFAHDQIARGAWSGAASSLLTASRLAVRRADRERLALEAVEATMYGGDGAAAKRLAEQLEFGDGPRRDSVLAYVAIFDGDLTAAQTLLTRAWERRDLAGDDRIAATIAQRSAFLATSRMRGREAVEWAERALALAPGDAATGLLIAPSQALGLSFMGHKERAHAALDRWLDGASAPERGGGFVLLALKGFLLLADGDVSAARTTFQASAQESLERGLLVIAALSLSGLVRTEFLAGNWDLAVVAAERAIALAVECEDRWVIGQAHWSASHVPAGRGEWAHAERHVRVIQEQAPTFERHVAAEAMATANLAAAQGRPSAVLRALDRLDSIRPADGVDDPTFFPWHHLKAHALVDVGEVDAARRWIAYARTLARDRANPLLLVRLAHAQSKLDVARHRADAAVAALHDARASVERLAMPYEQGLIELGLGQVLRRMGERRAAAAMLVAAQTRLNALGARPAAQRCQQELSACGLAPSARKSRDYTALTPQESAVARLVVSGMSNREVAEELMLSTKTVEFHLSNIYTKLGVRSRSELRARARANELAL